MINKKINITIILFLIIGALACTEIGNEPRNENQPPETSIFLYPSSNGTINQQKSRLQVHWWGEDPDGKVLGYYFRWVGLDSKWSFTTANDSLFSLPIGSADTTYTIEVMAVDVLGNKKYDNSVMWNGIDIGAEPFVDGNNNGVWDKGEKYFDIGMIDLTPASLKFPIKNTPPIIEWNKESVIPDETFPVITVAWDATDLDDDASIVNISLAINNLDLAVKLPGNTRLVTLRIKDINAHEPELEILVNGLESKLFDKTLKGLKLDDYNRLYVWASDISGSISDIQSLPDTSAKWFVKKPKGELLIVDDYEKASNATIFYKDVFSTIDGGRFANKFDVFDLEATKLPFANITFLETIKLFKYIYWYGDASPSLEVASSITQKYINGGGKIGYSLNFQEPKSSFTFDLATIQSFLPIEKFGEKKPISFMFAGANVLPLADFSDYQQLRTSSTISYVRTYIPNSLTAKAVYNLSSTQLNGVISIMNDDKKLFFIGLPLHSSNAIDNSVKKLIEKVYIDEFGM